MIIWESTFKELQPGLSGRIPELAPRLARAGCNAFKFPPFLNTKNGLSLGYDPCTDLDVGQWEPLHITGSAADLKAAIDALHQNGLLVIQDWVNRQYSGQPPLFERDPNGNVAPNLFPKLTHCFYPPAPDDTPFRGDNGEAYGSLASYQNTEDYMLNGKIQAGQWQAEVLGIDGFRLDEAKGLPPSVTAAWNQARPGLNFAEVFDGNADDLADFVQQTGMPALDFPRWYTYQNVSRGGSLSLLAEQGFCLRDPGNAVVFVESSDSDGPNGITHNKLWFYLDALTIPCRAAIVFAKDCQVYGLQPQIENLMWIGSAFAIGKLAWEFVDPTLICWSRDGDGGNTWSGGLLCGYSSNPVDYRSEWIHTPFGPNRQLHDYSGHGPDLSTNQDGWAYITFGPNVNGTAQNYVAYAPAGVDFQVPVTPRGRPGTGRFTDFSSITVQPPAGMV